MNQNSWLEEGRQLYRTHANSQFVIGDWVNCGIAAFGRTPAFDSAAEITGTKHTRNFFTRCSAVASYYKPELRFPKLSFHTYEVLARFSLSFLEWFIPAIAESGRSCAQILVLAVEQYGEDPRRKRKAGTFHAVRLPEKLFHSLAVHASSPDKTHLFVVRILEDYLAAAQSAEKSAQGSCPSDVPAPSDTQTRPETSAEESTPRPDYATRRTQQIADGAPPVPRKVRKPAKLKVQWLECRGESFVDTENGAVQFRVAGREKPTRFFSLEDAVEAEEEHFKKSHYHERVVHCASCSLQASTSRVKKQVWHVAHVYSSEVQAASLPTAARESSTDVR
jgi:hypothetical protein